MIGVQVVVSIFFYQLAVLKWTRLHGHKVVFVNYKYFFS